MHSVKIWMTESICCLSLTDTFFLFFTADYFLSKVSAEAPRHKVCISMSCTVNFEIGVIKFCHFFFHLFFGFPLRSLCSCLTWSEQRQRNMPTLIWSGVKRCTRTWVTRITSVYVSSQWWPTRSLFGRGLCLLVIPLIHDRGKLEPAV